MFQSTFCTKCGMKQRSPNHVCQPSAKDRFQRLQAWQKKSAAALKPNQK